MSDLKLVNLPSEGTYNIVKDYKWSLSSGIPSEGVKDIPYVELREFEQDVAGLYSQLSYWYRVATNRNAASTGKDLYKGLYSANATGTTYILPYYEDYHHAIQQRWAKNKGLFSFDLLDKGLKAASLVKQAMGAVGTYVNQPQVWEGVGEGGFNISFYLFNTDEGNKDSFKSGGQNLDFIKNKKFIDRLIMSTLHNQDTSIEATPPALFEVNVPGIRYSPAAVITSLNINNVGQINSLKLGDQTANIPDAYQIVIGISELISESRQIFNSVYGNLTPGNRVQAIEKASRTLELAIQDLENLTPGGENQ